LSDFEINLTCNNQYTDCRVIPVEITIGKDKDKVPMLIDFEERFDSADELGDGDITPPLSDEQSSPS